MTPELCSTPAAGRDPRQADRSQWKRVTAVIYPKLALRRHGVYKRALQLLLESAAKLPENPEGQYHVGMTQARRGNREEVKQGLAQALRFSLPHDWRFPASERLA